MQTYQNQDKPEEVVNVDGRVGDAETAEDVADGLHGCRSADDPAVAFTVLHSLGDV